MLIYTVRGGPATYDVKFVDNVPFVRISGTASSWRPGDSKDNWRAQAIRNALALKEKDERTKAGVEEATSKLKKSQPEHDPRTCNSIDIDDHEDTWIAKEIEDLYGQMRFLDEEEKVINAAKGQLRSRIMLRQSPPFCPMCQKNRKLHFIWRRKLSDNRHQKYRITAQWCCF